MVDVAPEVVDKGVVLRGVRHFIDGLELDFARYAAGFHQSNQWEAEGYNSAADWMRFNCHMNSYSVWNGLAVGEQEAKLAQSIDAMKGGEIGFAHLATLGRTADEMGNGFDEIKLLPLAKKHSPGKFHQKVLHFKHSVDAAGYNRDQERLAEERRLRMSTAQDGCLLLYGVLDPVGGAAVRTALEPLAQPSGAHDDRSREQRYADALVELSTAGRPAEIQVTATIETLKGMAGAAAAEMEFSLPISSATVRRLACDCSVTRVLLSEDSNVIDVGRSKRLVDGALRKALAVRDKHCQWPGCERPASWCDGHHIVHWVEGGETNLANCLLLCKRHHRMAHEGGWRLVRVNGRVVPVAPTITFGLPRVADDSARAPAGAV